MAFILVTIAALYCAFCVMRAQRLLHVTVWLAVTSALVSILLYLLGAPEVAVIELSVGAGLVTVLFVFAFSITGEITFDDLTIIPRPIAGLLALVAVALLAWFTLPLAPRPITGEGVTFARVLWEQRGLDVIAQVVLIFAGVMGLLGLLSEAGISALERRREFQASSALNAVEAGAQSERPNALTASERQAAQLASDAEMIEEARR